MIMIHLSGKIVMYITIVYEIPLEEFRSTIILDTSNAQYEIWVGKLQNIIGSVWGDSQPL